MAKYFLIVLICLPSFCFAQTPTQQLTRVLDQQRGFRANFEQIIRDENNQVLQRTDGSIAIQRPGKFYWEANKPTHQLIIANGKKLWIYDVDLEQAQLKTLEQGIGNTPALLLTGDTRLLEKKYTIKGLSRSDATWFELLPKEKESVFTKIQIAFTHNQLNQMILFDSLGQTTTVTFHQVNINPTFTHDFFQFTPPKGVDVIGQ